MLECTLLDVRFRRAGDASPECPAAASLQHLGEHWAGGRQKDRL